MAKSKFDYSKPKSGDSFCWTGPMFLARQNFPKDSCVVSVSRTMQENIVSSGASRFPVRHFRDQNDPHPCLGWKRRSALQVAFFLSDLGHGHRQFHCLQNGHHPFVKTVSVHDGYVVYKLFPFRPCTSKRRVRSPADDKGVKKLWTSTSTRLEQTSTTKIDRTDQSPLIIF